LSPSFVVLVTSPVPPPPLSSLFPYTTLFRSLSPTYLDELADNFGSTLRDLTLNHTLLCSPSLRLRTFSARNVFCVELTLSFVDEKRMYRPSIPLFYRKITPIIRRYFRHSISPSFPL